MTIALLYFVNVLQLLIHIIDCASDVYELILPLFQQQSIPHAFRGRKT